MTWGTGKWGTSPWGGGETTIGIASAVAASTHAVRVILTSEPLHASPGGFGDALNPATWTLQRLDTNAVFTITGIEMQSDVSVLIHTLEALGPYQVTHQVASTSLFSAEGDPISDPKSAQFRGLSVPASAAPSRAHVTRDLFNPPAPRNPLGGTLRVDAGGDYATVEGNEFVRKMIVRRLTTLPGEFFHLPKYGVGLREKQKLPLSDVRALKAQIAEAIRREPEVEQVAVTLTLTQKVLTVESVSKTNLGSVFTALPVNLGTRF